MQKLIEKLGDLDTYVPPGHDGTVNRRLTTSEFCENFEMVHGMLEPGGVAHRHSHADEHQVIYVVGGAADVELGDDAAVRVDAGNVIRIPPGVEHLVTSVGAESLELIIIYSPPLKRAT